jgi:hypothetical protein
MSHKVRVTYYFKDEVNRSDGLLSAEAEITRSWNGNGYEALTALAKRCTPGVDATWMTIRRTDKVDDSALTFRVSDLESIEYDEMED